MGRFGDGGALIRLKRGEEGGIGLGWGGLEMGGID